MNGTVLSGHEKWNSYVQVAMKACVIDARVLKLEPFGNETILYDIVMVDTHHYTFVKTHTVYNTKSEP